VAGRVYELNAVTGAFESAGQLSRHQERILAALTVDGRRDLTRAEVEVLTGLGKTAAYSELMQLVDARVLDVRGRGVRTTYQLPARLPHIDTVSDRAPGSSRPMERNAHQVGTREPRRRLGADADQAGFRGGGPNAALYRSQQGGWASPLGRGARLLVGGRKSRNCRLTGVPFALPSHRDPVSN
jgi:hypothetical protein